MFLKEQYSLVDFGNGRRLERFGDLLLDRLCPSAYGIVPSNKPIWKFADAKFEENRSLNSQKSSTKDTNVLGIRGQWIPLTEKGRHYFDVQGVVNETKGQENYRISSRPWQISFADLFTFELKGSPFGHIGVFPEQAENWDRIYDFCKKAEKILKRPPRLLNLFGYTGGSALAVAAAGGNVTHLDAARNVVAQARRNASISFGENTSIRWIVDDAVKFVKREINRDSFYDGVILDPPTYGHGSKGEVWRLQRDLQPLLGNIVRILNKEYSFIMLSGHTPGFEASVFESMLKTAIMTKFNIEEIGTKYLAKTLEIKSEMNKTLYSGDVAIVYIHVR